MKTNKKNGAERMNYRIDHDLHIHSQLSSCSADAEQNPVRLLRYAKENALKTICVTDHFWDETVEGASPWYAPQNFAHITRALPLPQEDGIRFLFGCETELNRDLTLGISKERMEQLDFIIIPTTHFHMETYTLFEEDMADAQGRVNAWIRRVGAVLDMDLPFYKVGLAHLTCAAIAPERETYLEVLLRIPAEELVRLFTKAANLGVGIELNASDMDFADEEADTVLRMYRIAKECGCKFYCGSDAHHPDKLEKSIPIFERAVRLLDLKESDKFTFGS